jgi:TM2 domain-containing membrane protein YozV
MSLLLALALAASSDAPACVAAAEAVAFGDWLAGRGDHYRAIGEYERALYLGEGRCAPEAVTLRMARAYALGAQVDEAADLARPIARGGPAPLRDEATLVLAFARHRAGDDAGALSLARAVVDGGGDPRLARRARLVAALSLAATPGRERAATEAVAPLAAAPDLAPAAAAVEDASRALARAPRKSPALAGVLSALLPGLGQVYDGEPAAGAAALAVNGLFVWAAVDAFRGGHDGLGAVAVAVESLWYGGAIFGAVSGAHRSNRDARAAILEELGSRIRPERELLPPPPPLSFTTGGAF